MKPPIGCTNNERNNNNEIAAQLSRGSARRRLQTQQSDASLQIAAWLCFLLADIIIIIII